VIRYLLFITVYHRLFVLWLVVGYSGLSRHLLLGYESRPINTSLLTVECLSTYVSSLFYHRSLPIPSISTIIIEGYLFCLFYRYRTVSQPLVISKAPCPSRIIGVLPAPLVMILHLLQDFASFSSLLVVYSYLPETTGDIATIPVSVSWFFSCILLIQQKNFIITFIPTLHPSNQVIRDHQ
jgi:hypothetical protein